ncbi:hypothetical protein [Alysiella filiformis]|nr:hypothetical protein [Alysiella filiformis]
MLNDFPSPQPSPKGEGAGCVISTIVGNVYFCRVVKGSLKTHF